MPSFDTPLRTLHIGYCSSDNQAKRELPNSNATPAVNVIFLPEKNKPVEVQAQVVEESSEEAE